jgi:hypothetical protein
MSQFFIGEDWGHVRGSVVPFFHYIVPIAGRVQSPLKKEKNHVYGIWVVIQRILPTSNTPRTSPQMERLAEMISSPIPR